MTDVEHGRTRTGLVVVVVLIALAAGIGAYLITSNKKTASTAPSGSSTTTVPTAGGTATVINPADISGKNRFGLALGDHLWPKSTNDRAWEARIDDIAGTGTHWVRMSFPWQNVEPSSGKFVFGTANYVADYLNSKQLKLDLILNSNQSPKWSTTNSLYNCGSNPPDHNAATSPPGYSLEDYASFAGALAGDLYDHPSVAAIELGNEPNHAIGARTPNVCLYTAQDRMGYAAVQAAVKAKGDIHRYTILNAGLTGGPATRTSVASQVFLERMYEDNNNSSAGLFDAFSYHPFSHPNSPEQDLLGSNADHTACTKTSAMPISPKGWCGLLLNRQVMLNHHDGAKMVWLTAWGIPTIPANRAGSGPAPLHWKDGSVISQGRWSYLLRMYQPPDVNMSPNPPDCGPTADPTASTFPQCSVVGSFLGAGSANAQTTGIAQGYHLIETPAYDWVGPLFYYTYNDRASPASSNNGDKKGDPYNGDFSGLVDFNGVHKPAYATYQSLVAAAK